MNCECETSVLRNYKSELSCRKLGICMKNFRARNEPETYRVYNTFFLDFEPSVWLRTGT
jgi:hypothetical protein